MGKSCSKICHFHQRSNSSTTFVIVPEPQEAKPSISPEIALVTTNFTEENVDEGVVIELPDSDLRRDEHFQALQTALRQENSAAFQTALEHAEKLRDEDAFGLLLGACVGNQTDIAKMVIGRVRSVNCFTYPYENPLLLAIKHKNIEVVMALIEAGALLSPRLDTEEEVALFSPVLAAVRAGDKDVLKLLVDMGGDLTLKLVRTTQDGKTVLDLADPRNEDLMDYLQATYTVENIKVPATLENTLIRLFS